MRQTHHLNVQESPGHALSLCVQIAFASRVKYSNRFLLYKGRNGNPVGLVDIAWPQYAVYLCRIDLASNELSVS